MCKKLLLTAMLVVMASAGLVAQMCSVRCYFVSPEVDGVIETAIIEAINKARKSVDIAMFSFTDDQLGDAVVRAHRRGVAVRVILGAGQDSVGGGERSKLLSAGIPVGVARTSGIFHHKFAVIDGSLVITGSYDWTDGADKESHENVVFISCPGQTTSNTVVGQYVRQFNGLWEQLGGVDRGATTGSALDVGASLVIINDVDQSGECIQLLNISVASLDLAGWTISDLEGSYTFPQNTLIHPNDPYQVCIGTYNPTYDGQGLYLNDVHDEIFLTTPEGKIVDEVVW